MGLKDLSVEKFEKLQELLELLEVFGLTEKDLYALSQLVHSGAVVAPSVEITDEEKAEIDKINRGVITPEEYISSFKGSAEEFYPDGKPIED